eukprot:scaffold112224_cov66-Phaeocystis_antarctica.AAC.2
MRTGRHARTRARTTTLPLSESRGGTRAASWRHRPLAAAPPGPCLCPCLRPCSRCWDPETWLTRSSPPPHWPPLPGPPGYLARGFVERAQTC